MSSHSKNSTSGNSLEDVYVFMRGVCVRERERKSENKGERERAHAREREREREI